MSQSVFAICYNGFIKIRNKQYYSGALKSAPFVFSDQVAKSGILSVGIDSPGKSRNGKARMGVVPQTGELDEVARGRQSVYFPPALNAKEVRESMENLVRLEAIEITQAIIEAAKGGQLAHAKYLFELGGIHPLAGNVQENPHSESLIQSLLRRADEAREAAGARDQIVKAGDSVHRSGNAIE
jgi:hypothetical protein